MSRLGEVVTVEAADLRAGDVILQVLPTRRYGGFGLARTVTGPPYVDEYGQVSFVFADGALTLAPDRLLTVRRPR